MPTENFYQGLTLSEQLAAFAKHHSEKKQRHISKYEFDMLGRAEHAVGSKEPGGIDDELA